MNIIFFQGKRKKTVISCWWNWFKGESEGGRRNYKIKIRWFFFLQSYKGRCDAITGHHLSSFTFLSMCMFAWSCLQYTVQFSIFLKNFGINFTNGKNFGINFTNSKQVMNSGIFFLGFRNDPFPRQYGMEEDLIVFKDEASPVMKSLRTTVRRSLIISQRCMWSAFLTLSRLFLMRPWTQS